MTRCGTVVLTHKVLLEELGHTVHAKIRGDASAALQAAAKLANSRMKHMELQQNFIQQIVRQKLVKLEKQTSAENVADLLTKFVKTEVLNALVHRTGFCAHDGSTFEVAPLNLCNEVGDLQDTSELMRAHRVRKQQSVIERALAYEKQAKGA